jgi:uncharacterized membrane protein YciS (DUF1049 family)
MKNFSLALFISYLIVLKLGFILGWLIYDLYLKYKEFKRKRLPDDMEVGN